MTPAQKSPQKKKNPFFKALVILLVVALIGLSLTRLVLSNVLATSGQFLSAANQKIEMLDEENQKLDNDISESESLANIEDYAKRAQLVKTVNIEVLTGSKPIASR